MGYTKCGTLFNTEFGTIIDDQQYCIRIEAGPRIAALLFALGIEYRYISPEEDSGRAWYQFCYSSALDYTLKEFTDFAGDVIYGQPKFGQMTLFDEETVNG